MTKPIQGKLIKCELSKLVAVCALLLIACAIGARILSLVSLRHNPDETAFALEGSEILYGRLPPSGIFDNKPVGLGYVFALFELVFGRTWLAMRMVALAAALATAEVVRRTAQLITPPVYEDGTAVFVLTGVAVYLGVSLRSEGGFAMSELVACPAIALANYVVLRKMTGATIASVMACAQAEWQTFWLAMWPATAARCASRQTRCRL